MQCKSIGVCFEEGGISKCFKGSKTSVCESCGVDFVHYKDVGKFVCCDSCGRLQRHMSESDMLIRYRPVSLESPEFDIEVQPLVGIGKGIPKTTAPMQSRSQIPGLRGWIKCSGELRPKKEILEDRASFSNKLSELRVWSLLFMKLYGRKAKVLDLFSGQGGAAHGLALNLFEVRSVDILSQPLHTRHPGVSFCEGDAMTQDLSWADMVWASPPCQSYSTLPKVSDGKGAQAD